MTMRIKIINEDTERTAVVTVVAAGTAPAIAVHAKGETVVAKAGIETFIGPGGSADFHIHSASSLLVAEHAVQSEIPAGEGADEVPVEEVPSED
jgi:hypothetical protein